MLEIVEHCKKHCKVSLLRCQPLLLIDGYTCVATLHDLRHGGEVQDGRAGQHEAVLQISQNILHSLTAQRPATELLLHKLTAAKERKKERKSHSCHAVSVKHLLSNR